MVRPQGHSHGQMDEDYKQLLHQASKLVKAEYLFYAQHAKLHYLKNVDNNTTFCHALVKRNNKHREIVADQKPDGVLTISLDEVMAEFHTHFKNLISTEIPRSTF